MPQGAALLAAKPSHTLLGKQHARGAISHIASLRLGRKRHIRQPTFEEGWMEAATVPD